MCAAQQLPTVTLDVETVFVRPIPRAWTAGYPETWDYIEAPKCAECAERARWRTGKDLASVPEPETFAEHDELQARIEAAGLATDDALVWRCVNVACEQYGREVDPHEDVDGGPAMNFLYPLPDPSGPGGRRFDEVDADLLADLPVCIVFATGAYEEDGERMPDFSLVLTGGGMDLSWEIAEAYARLGFCPPLHFCGLPGMAGRGREHERDRFVIAACLRSCEYAERRARRVAGDLRVMAGIVPDGRYDLEGFDPLWSAAMNRALEDREVSARVETMTHGLWDRYIGPMLDAVEHDAEPTPGQQLHDGEQ